jgi:hypothetical protein
MSKRLPVPPELEHLLEKREHESDRRGRAERSGAGRRKEDLGPPGASESAGKTEDVPTADRRSGKDRRQKVRRKKSRRKKDG